MFTASRGHYFAKEHLAYLFFSNALRFWLSFSRRNLRHNKKYCLYGTQHNITYKSDISTACCVIISVCACEWKTDVFVFLFNSVCLFDMFVFLSVFLLHSKV
jgi:hypothetical protein